jgi:WD40 repeat protein
MSEKWIESELKAALEETYRPAPWLLSNSIAAARRIRPKRSAAPWLAGIAAVLIAVSSIATFEAIRHYQNRNRPQSSPVNAWQLPIPIPQAITRTSAGAQVAWLFLESQGQQVYLAVDRNGRVVARLSEPLDVYVIWRSADGAEIYAPGATTIAAYSALNGQFERSYSRNPGTIVNFAFSPDGRWLAVLILNGGLQLQLIDLHGKTSQLIQVPHDPNANVPGMSCSPNPTCSGTVAWGLVAFSPDSSHLYTLTDWGGPVRISAFSLAGGKLGQTASAVDGGEGRKFSTCGGPAMVAKVIGGGKTLVAFCHVDGVVWFFDLSNLTESGVIRTNQPNPFGLSPIFTPDGQLLYLHQSLGFGDTMQVVDLTTRRLLGPVPTPTNPNQNGPFGWLITNAYAGGFASTVPVSPDGLTLYSATSTGVMVLRVPDLKPVAKLGPGFNANEVWISGDGQTIYATSNDGKTLMVMRADGSSQHTVNLPYFAGGFVASEHG